jgi:hypothetical protein
VPSLATVGCATAKTDHRLMANATNTTIPSAFLILTVLHPFEELGKNAALLQNLLSFTPPFC